MFEEEEETEELESVVYDSDEDNDVIKLKIGKSKFMNSIY